LINISKQREPDVENADQQQKMSISDVITPVIPLICESVMLYSTPTLLYDKLILCYRDTIEDEDYTQNYREFSKLCAQFMGIFMFVNNKLNNNKEDEKADVDVDEDEDVDENVIKHAISCKNELLLQLNDKMQHYKLIQYNNFCLVKYLCGIVEWINKQINAQDDPKQ
jgi:hypothetical protein